MGIRKNLTHIIKKILLPLRKAGVTDEENYYTYLFTKNPNWNKTEPNAEEKERWEIIKEFIQTCKVKISNPQILDLGCGRGWLTHLLSKYGPTVGVEPVEAVVRYAQKLFPELQISHGTTTSLLSDGLADKFDIIVCSEVIEHIAYKRKPQFISQIERLTKKNGHVIITTPRKEAQALWSANSDPSQPIEDWLTEKDLQALFEENGFKKKELRRISVNQEGHENMIEIYQLWLFQKNL